MIKSFQMWLEPYKKMGIKPGTQTVKTLLNHLGNPQDQIKVIHITGTNGKGTTARLFHNVLWKAGYKTGLFMSPYLNQPEEMCVIDGEQISSDLWLDLAEKIQSKLEVMISLGQDLPTEYEIYAAMMYLYFKEADVDFAVVEVAMGGENDCTNVIKKPVLTVITAIDLDHQKFLGDTVLQIAKEKSGIMKMGCPQVLHKQNKEIMAYFEKKSREMKVPISLVEADDRIKYSDYQMIFDYKGLTITTSLLGKHQKQNIIGVIEGLEILDNHGHLILCHEILKRAIKETILPCRFEKIGSWILDGAHNDSSLLALKNTLHDLGLKDLVGVVGVLLDKENLQGFKALRPYFKKMILLEPLNDRKCPNNILKQRLESIGYERVIEASNVNEAIGLGQRSTEFKLAFGSFYMVGPLRDHLETQVNKKENLL